MSDFLHFLAELVPRFPLHVYIGYTKTCDWVIEITKRGCADDYPRSARSGDSAILADVQGCDLELCCAEAHVALKKWLLENDGGY